MRPLSTLETIVDDDGLPINGRVKVFVLGEGTTAQIYDYEGNVIANPQPLVNGVTAKQIFLPDHDVSVEVQVLVDPAFPSSDDSWECVRSVVDTYRTVDITNDSKGVYIVNGKNQLRDTTPEQVQASAGVKYVQLYGSSGAGPLTYGWVQGYSVNDNDGDVIASSGDLSGRWVAVFAGDYVDSRYFGITPKATPGQLTAADGSRVSTFVNRCAAIGKRPYFPATATNSYYNIANNIVNRPAVDNGTVFANLEGNNATVIDTEVHLYSASGYGKITLNADTVRTSLNMNLSMNVVLEPRVRAIIDTVYFSNYRWNGVDVVLDVDQERGLFSDCRFSGSGRISGGSFTRCEVYESLFSEDFAVEYFDFDNCSSNISLWSDFDKYLDFCIANGEVEVDMHGNTVTRFLESVNPLKLVNAIVDYAGVVPARISFSGCTFNRNPQSTFWKCTECTFEKNVRCVTDESSNTSGKVTGMFVSCVFNGNSHIIMDFGTSVRSSLEILPFVVNGCIFNGRSPVSVVYTGESTETANKNAIRELSIDNLVISDCTGVTWETDSFVVTKAVEPATTIQKVYGQSLLGNIEMPFTHGSGRWEMELGLYHGSEGMLVSETGKKNYCGRWDYLASSNTNTDAISLGSMPNEVVAYAKIRRIK